MLQHPTEPLTVRERHDFFVLIENAYSHDAALDCEHLFERLWFATRNVVSDKRVELARLFTSLAAHWVCFFVKSNRLVSIPIVVFGSFPFLARRSAMCFNAAFGLLV